MSEKSIPPPIQNSQAVSMNTVPANAANTHGANGTSPVPVVSPPQEEHGPPVSTISIATAPTEDALSPSPSPTTPAPSSALIASTSSTIATTPVTFEIFTTPSPGYVANANAAATLSPTSAANTTVTPAPAAANAVPTPTSNSSTLDEAIQWLCDCPATAGATFANKTTNNAEAYAVRKKKLLGEFIEVMEDNKKVWVLTGFCWCPLSHSEAKRQDPHCIFPVEWMWI